MLDAVQLQQRGMRRVGHSAKPTASFLSIKTMKTISKLCRQTQTTPLIYLSAFLNFTFTFLINRLLDSLKYAEPYNLRITYNI